MRRVYIIIAAILLLTTQASTQSIVLHDVNNNTINNGDTILVISTTNDPGVSTVLYVFNSAATTKDVLVEKQHLYLVPGAETFFSWVIDALGPAVFISPPYPAVMQPGDTEMFEAAYFNNGNAGTSFVKYRFFDSNNAADSAWVIIQYNILQVAGINDISNVNGLDIYPNPGTGAFRFFPPGDFQKQFSVEVLSPQGAIIQKRNFNSLSLVSVDITAEEAGIYFLRLNDGKKAFVKKIVKE